MPGFWGLGRFEPFVSNVTESSLTFFADHAAWREGFGRIVRNWEERADPPDASDFVTKG